MNESNITIELLIHTVTKILRKSQLNGGIAAAAAKKINYE